MVNHDSSESILDTLILQVFEDQEDAFSFPLTTMKETRDFVRLLNRQGFTYEMICAEIDEKFEAFRNWRLGGGPDTIGRRMMIRINKPLQEAMLSDGEEEDEEALRNGTAEDQTDGGVRRKKSVDGGGGRRRSKGKINGGKKGKVKDEKEDSGGGGANVVDAEKKGEVNGQEVNGQEVKGQGHTETAKSEKKDTTDGKKEPTAKQSVANDNSGKSESARVNEKDNVATVVAPAKDATPSNSVKTNKDQTIGGNETVKDGLNVSTKQNISGHVEKDASKEHGTSTDLKKEQESKPGKKDLKSSTETKQKELATSTEAKQNDLKSSNETKQKELETKGVTNQKALEADAETKPKARTEPEPKSPSVSATKLETKKPEANDKDHKKQNISDVQTSSEKEKKDATDNFPKTKIDTQSPKKISEAVHPPTQLPINQTGTSPTEQKSDPAKLQEKTVGQDTLKKDGLDAKIFPVESKISSKITSKLSSAVQHDKAVLQSPDKETAPSSTLTTENQLMVKPASIVRSKSDTVEPKIDETTKAPNLTRASSDSADLFRPSATPKPDLPTTPSEANQSEVDENYDSDLDPETSDRSPDDRVMVERLRSLKRNETKDGPGHLFVFSDTPAATGTGKHRVRIGISRFPEKRLLQAQLFNPDMRMVTSAAVAMRKEALCRAQEELKSLSLRGKRGWYWGSLEVILKAVADLSVVKEEEIE